VLIIKQFKQVAEFQKNRNWQQQVKMVGTHKRTCYISKTCRQLGRFL